MSTARATLEAIKSQPVKSLYRHFLSATSAHKPSVSQLADQAIDANSTSERPDYHAIASATVDKSLDSQPNPVFGDYCLEADKHYGSATKEVREQYERTIREYMELRHAAAHEMHIMELNRVGVDKNMKNIIEQTAKHVGLAMPKAWQDSVKDPFASKDAK